MTKLERLTIQEINNIRVYATKQERDKIEPSRINPDLQTFCVYGMMTGNCYSRRAKQLLNICAIPFSYDLDKIEEPRYKSFRRYRRDVRSFSALEYYIYKYSDIEVYKRIVSYLQEKTDKIIL